MAAAAAGEAIAALRIGLDQAGETGCGELGPEARDVDLDAVGAGLEIEPPHVAQQPGARDPLAGPLGEPPQQRELARVQRQPASTRRARRGGAGRA